MEQARMKDRSQVWNPNCSSHGAKNDDKYDQVIEAHLFCNWPGLGCASPLQFSSPFRQAINTGPWHRRIIDSGRAPVPGSREALPRKYGSLA